MRLCNGATYFRAQAKYSTQQFVTALWLLIMIVLALFFLSRSAQKYSISAAAERLDRHFSPLLLPSNKSNRLLGLSGGLLLVEKKSFQSATFVIPRRCQSLVDGGREV
jgi:hypothetical protein